MALLRFMQQESGASSSRVVFMVVFSGLATGLLVSVINLAADASLTKPVEGRMLFLYLAILVLYLYTQKYSLAHTIYPFDHALYNLRLRLTDKAMSHGLRAMERLPPYAAHTILASEFNLAAQLLPWVTYSAQAAAVLGFCLLYLAWLSFAGFLVVIVTLAGAGLWHFVFEKQLYAEFRAIAARERLFANHLDGLRTDAIDIRLNLIKKKYLFHALRLASNQGKELKMTIDQQTISSIMSIRIALFLLLAIFIFILPLYDPNDSALIFKITVVTFFIISPITQMVYALPLLLRLDSALHDIYAFEGQLDTNRPELPPTKPAAATDTGFEEIRWASLGFDYHGGQPDPTRPPLLQDINLTVRPGEIIFIQGPCGSGKTTLLKLLCGLYSPDAGAVYIDKRKLNDNGARLRDLFTCVLPGAPPPQTIHAAKAVTEGAVRELLEKMALDHAVEYENSAFRYDFLPPSLSWRLQVTVALAEDRPVYLFDDCALGQDEHFIRLFFEEILDDLRNQGKTVIAVLRDNRFAHLADYTWEIREHSVHPHATEGSA